MSAVAARTSTAERRRMRAIVRDRYCSPDELAVREVDVPEVADDEVLVRVRATSINRADWYGIVGKPYLARPMIGLLKPKLRAVGGDFAGVAEAAGHAVTDIRPGDEVFGARGGAFAEYVAVRNGIARKPANLTFEEAAAVPVAALTALQALRDHGKLQPGQAVLINGASGGVGTFAIQIAKALGAEVTAVCSTRNVELARSLGADAVVDYTREDFTRRGDRYDLLFDNAGSRSWSACKRVLKPRATAVIVGGKSTGLLGPLGHITATWVGGKLSSRSTRFFIAKVTREDLGVLRELIESGEVKPVVERTYALDQIGEALRYMGEGHAQGKLVVSV